MVAFHVLKSLNIFVTIFSIKTIVSIWWSNCESYGTEVFDRLLEAKLVDDLQALRLKTNQKPWLVVSGGYENELNLLFRQRGIIEYFDGGIYGSPRNKKQIFSQLFLDKKISQRSVFLVTRNMIISLPKSFKLTLFLFMAGVK